MKTKNEADRERQVDAVVSGDVFCGVKTGDIVDRGQIEEMLGAAGFKYVLKFTYQSNPTRFLGFEKIK